MSSIASDSSHTTQSTPRRLLVGGLVPLAAAALLTCVVAVVRGGMPALVAAVVGAVLAAAALAVGPGLMAWSARTAPQLALVMGLMGYAVTILLLGAALLLLRTSDWLARGYLAAGLVFCTLAWLLGQAWTIRRLRTLAFGDTAPVERDGTQ